jgi:recombinational DNA repair protein RecT
MENKTNPMEPKAKSKLEHLNSLQPLSFCEDDQIKSSFLKLHAATHPGESQDDAESFYERESNYFKRLLFNNPELRKCTLFSLYGCFMDIVVNGLSFEPSANLLYIEVRSANVGTKDSPQWEKRASNKISPYGELTLRIKCGQIKYIDTPVIVYEGDLFKKGYSQNGAQYVVYEAAIPRASNQIQATFVKITRPDGSFDFPHMEKADIERLRKYSERQNSRGNEAPKANALYGSDNGQIDPGFLKAKTIRHAFKAYPKVNIMGAWSEIDEEEVPQVYNVDEPIAQAEAPAPFNSEVPGFIKVSEEGFTAPSLNGRKLETVSFDHDEF